MILGILSILYYLSIGISLKRWDSRFPRFFLAAGCVLIGYDLASPYLPDVLQQGIRMICVLVGILFFLIECQVFRYILFDCVDRECDYIIVLGAKVNGTRLTSVLKKRLDKAVRYLNQYPKCQVIVSGGQGIGEQVTEAFAMAEYLQDCGIDAQRIEQEAASTTTRENLAYSKAIIKNASEGVSAPVIGIVTNNFHMFRSIKIAQQIGIRHPVPLPAPTSGIMMGSYVIREFFGVMKMWIHRNRQQ